MMPSVEMGRLELEKIPAGMHSVKVVGPNGDASFSFELALARPPAITGTINTRNVLAVLLPSFAGQARVVTSSGPWKMTVNNQPESDAGPAGVVLKTFTRARMNWALCKAVFDTAFQKCSARLRSLLCF
jgi:hypothetical protein